MELDLSNLQQPGAASGPMPTPNTPAPPPEALLPAVAEPSMVEPGINPQVPPAPPAGGTPVGTPNVGGHQKLLSMVQGLADGLAGFSKSIATHGQVSGAEVVQELQGQRQAQRQAEQAAAQARQNAELQQKIMTGEIARQNAQNWILLGTMHDEVDKSHFEAQGAKQSVIGQSQDIRAKALQDYAVTGDLNAYNKTLQQLDQSSGAPSAAPTSAAQAAPGAAPVAGTPAAAGATPNLIPGVTPGAAAKPPVAPPTGGPAVVLPPAAVAGWKNSIDTAVGSYSQDADIQAAAAQFKSAQSLPDQQAASLGMAAAARVAANRKAALDAATESQTKQQTLQAGARPKDLNDATGRLTQAQQAYKADPTPDTKLVLDNAKAAQASFLSVDRQQKQIAQDIQNGDPHVIGAAMANGLYAPSQVLSARSMSKPFYSKVIAAANDAAKANGAPEILGPNGQHTGQYFNAAVAEGQYKYSTNVQTQNTLNKILTLNETGGDLDILKDATTALPKLDNKTINQIFNAGATEFGSPEATNYHMALYNLASLLAQVQTGGIPTEGEIQQQLNLMNASFSKGQLDGAIQIARRDIAARGTSMVANNPYLRAAYPTLAGSAQKQTSVANPSAVPGLVIH